MATQASLDLAQQMYVAYYGRPADPAGQLYWAEQFDASEDLTQALAAFGNSEEFTAGFGSLDNEALVTNLFQQLFGRAPEADGLAFYVAKLDSEESTLASIAKEIADGAQNDDLTTLNNRVAVANTYTTAVETQGATYTEAEIADAQAILAAVDATEESVTASNTAAEAEVEANVPVTGETFTLTAGTDSFAGTVENDSITGSINTLTANDRIIDESTTDSDSLSVELLGGSAIPSSVEIKNIEEMNFNVLSGAATIDAGNFSGYKTITAEGTGTLTLTNLNDKSAELAVKGNASLNATHSTAAVAGANDAINVTLDSVTGGTVTIGAGVETLNLTTAGAAATLGNFTGASVTTVAIKGGQGFTLGTPATGFANATTIDAREAGKAAFTSSAAGAVAVLTGAADDTITRTVDFAAADLFNLGAGNDTLVMANATTDTNQASFVGVDNIVFKGAASEIDMAKADQAAALTFEGGGAIIADNLASGSTVTSTKAAAAAVTVDFRDTVMGEATTVDLKEGTSAAVSLVNVKDATINYGKASGAATINLDATAGGTEVTTDLTVNAKGALTALSLATAGELKNLTINAEAAVAAAAAQTVNKLETLEVNNTSNAAAVTLAGVTATNTAGLTSVKLDAAGGAITTGTIQNSGAIKDVAISGSKDVTAAFISTAANVEKVVSTATADTSITITNAGTAGEAGSTVTLGDAALGKSNTLTITAGTDVNNTVTGGSGVDNITIASAGADTINAGAGNDAVSVAGGANNLTGGAGQDTFTFTGGVGAADAAALAAKHTVITDFKGTAADKDVLDFGANVTIATDASGITVSTGATGGLITDFGANASTTLAEKITAAALVTNSGAANDAVAFVHEGKSYLFVDAAGNTTVDAADTLIELTGVSLSAGFELSGGDIINFA